MFSRNSNQHANQTYLVTKRLTAVYNVQDNHVNTSNGQIVVTDGQLGFFDASGFGAQTANKLNKSVIPANLTATKVPVFKILQGNENSAAPWVNTVNYPLWNRPYEESMPIHADGFVQVTKQDYQAPTLSAWVIGKPTASTTGKITAQGLVEYQLRVGFRGQMSEEFYNTEEALYLSASYTTPNYTSLGTAQPIDDLVQHLVYDINRNSSAFAQNKTRGGSFPVVAFAIDSTATAGVLISALTAGTFLPLTNTSTGIKGIYPTAEQITAITAAAVAAGYSTADTILTVDLTTAGTVVGGIADGILLLALDNNAAFKDYTTSRKNRLTLGLNRGFDFNLVAQTEGSKAFDGQGIGRILDRQYRNTHGQRKYNLIHVTDPVIEFPSPIDTTDTYTTYSIEHSFSRQSDIMHISANSCKEIVLVPTLVKGTVNGSANSQETSIELFLNTWLLSANKAQVMNHSAV